MNQSRKDWEAEIYSYLCDVDKEEFCGDAAKRDRLIAVSS